MSEVFAGSGVSFSAAESSVLWPRQLRLYYQVRARYPEFSWRLSVGQQLIIFRNYPETPLEDRTMARPSLPELAAGTSASIIARPQRKRVTDATIQRYEQRRRRRIGERRERDGRE